jgi:tetratricopeptide (TPR) repeat protein
VIGTWLPHLLLLEADWHGATLVVRPLARLLHRSRMEFDENRPGTFHSHYRGLWDEAVLAAEEALPVAWEISEWGVVFFSSAWLAIAHLKLGQPDKARRVLDHLFNEAPARIYKLQENAIAYAQIARAQVHLTMGHLGEALSTVSQALAAAERGALRLEEVAAHRVLGQVREAMGDRAAADAAFRRSLEVLDEMQCPPNLLKLCWPTVASVGAIIRWKTGR